MNIDEEKYIVIKGMQKYGGGFVNSLSEALARADIINTSKIKETWPEYWKQYLEMGKPKEENL